DGSIGLSAGILATTIDGFAASPVRVGIGEEVTFFINASSDTSTLLDVLIRFDSQLVNRTNNTASPYEEFTGVDSPCSIITTYSYDSLGNITHSITGESMYIVTVYVGDGTNTVKLTKTIYVVENVAPEFLLKPGSRIVSAVKDEPYTIVVKTQDEDDDPLLVTWDFGDGSGAAVNETGPAGSGVYTNQTHTWTFELEPGVGDVDVSFLLNITVDDGQGHVLKATSEVVFYIPLNWVAENITLVASSTVVAPSDIVLFSATASDKEGDQLTWTFVFSDGLDEFHYAVYHTDATAPNTLLRVNTSYTFDALGEYMVRVYVVDAISPDLVLSRNQSSGGLDIMVVENAKPFVSGNITVVSPNAELIVINRTTGGINVTFSIMAIDADGDVLTATWDFGDGSEPSVNATSGGTGTNLFVNCHEFTASGVYNVSVVVTDGRADHEVTRYKLVSVRSENLGPTFKSLRLNMSHGSFGAPNTVVVFTLVLSDFERDPLQVTWDFGDNSSLYIVTASEYDSNGNMTIIVEHLYTTIDDYEILITYTDSVLGTGTHTKSYEAYVRIRIPIIQEVRIWNWWDYFSLGVVLVSLGAIGARTVTLGRYRKMLDMHGTTLEEFNVRKNEIRDTYKERMAESSDRSAAKKSMKQDLKNLNKMRKEPPEI
ncbi:MAG: PKD domain-containing protein, partial [Thermoplasmata archaeon]|nr:PKD domain-containing protein [Thermoplasmata archaeon]